MIDFNMRSGLYCQELSLQEEGMLTVIVKCVSCGAKREIKPGEISKDDVPMCDKCVMPMVLTKAKSR